MKAVLRGKFIALSAFTKKLKSSQASNIKLHLKTLGTKEASTPQRSRWQKIIKLRDEINKLDTEKLKPRTGPLKKINKINKPLAKLTKRQRDSIQILKISKEKGDITTDTEEIQRIIKSYFNLII